MIGRPAEPPLTRSPTVRRSLRVLTGILGSALLLVAAAGVGAHFFGPVSTAVTLLASFSPLAIAFAALSGLLLVAARLGYAALAALLVVAVGVAAQLPLFVGDRAPEPTPASPSIRIMQANLMLGSADAQALVERVRSADVDVLTVAELTGPAVDRLAAAGIDRSMPYSYLAPREGGGGEGIYSRYPLTASAELDGLQHNNLRADITVPGARPIAIYALHPVPPYPLPAWHWALELDRIAATLAAEPLPLIVGADFNSTYDHERFRALLRAGGRDGVDLVDAAERLGSGIVATYPADTWYPALLAIDRILARGATPSSFRRVPIPGSDHYGVIGEMLLEPATRD